MPGVGIGISPVFSRGGYNAATQAWIDRVIAEGGSVTPTEANAINTFTNSISISEADRFWVFGLQNEIAARTSIANAATADLITNVNITTFTAGVGYTGNGTTMYLETGFIPNTNGVKFTLNDCSFGIYVRNNTTGYALGGGSGANFVGLAPRTGINTLSSEINSTASSVLSNSNSIGFWVAGRTGSTNPFIYKDGSEQTITINPNLSSTGLTGNEITLLAYSGAFQTSHQLSICFFGSSALNTGLNAEVQTLATTLGFNN